MGGSPSLICVDTEKICVRLGGTTVLPRPVRRAERGENACYILYGSATDRQVMDLLSASNLGLRDRRNLHLINTVIFT